jgi:uncharacterized repeat protein (TIGR03837 family)
VPASPLLWDIFCQVVDNHGDLGVCWRLSRELAARGQQVRLWLDDARALPWMAPGALQGGVPGVRVLPWTRPLAAAVLRTLPRADVWIEAFGCELPPEFMAASADAESLEAPQRPPVWINLEYLSAEPYVERMHGLPSPVQQGPAAGRTKWFFYPGFTARTGGLLREHDLATRQTGFDRTTWRASLGVADAAGPLVSLFCYEPPALPALLGHLRADHAGARLLVTAGRATQAVQRAIARENSHLSASTQPEPLWISYLPALPQTDYDRLLWACDLNFVRGEDSLVRALWAGAPFVWHIYPQHDDAHHAKLAAFLDWLDAPPSLRRFHLAWNGIGDHAALPPLELPAWRACVRAARARLLAQPGLCGQLVEFALAKG